MFPCCCAGVKYSVAKHDNDSTFANIWTANPDTVANTQTSGLVLDSGEVVTVFPTTKGAGTLGAIGNRLDATGANIQDFEANTSLSNLGGGFVDICIDSSGNVYVPTNYSTGVEEYHVRQFDSSGTRTGGVVLDATADRCVSCAVDGSGNLYCVGTHDFGFSSADHSLYKFNSSGVKQWATLVVSAGTRTTQSRTWIDTSGDIWCYADSTITRVNSSGTIQATASAVLPICWDRGTGFIKANGTNLSKHDNTCASVSSIAETENDGAIECDASGNIYLVYRGTTGFTLNSKPSIKVWDSSLTPIYTKALFGTTFQTLSDFPKSIAADADYVWIAGGMQT
jgi:hypothetical protein